MRRFRLLILLVLLCEYIYPQTSSHPLDVICPAADYHKGKSANISWTIGEPVIETFRSKNNKYNLTQGFEQAEVFSNTHALYGYITYNNIVNTPMTNVWVYLVNSEKKIIDSIQTNEQGYFIFKNVEKGTYSLSCKTNKSWGSYAVNPLDALLVNRSFVGSIILSDFRKISGNVVQPITGIPTPTDAFFINKRYIKAISKFDIPDWLFQDVPVNISGNDVSQNILSLCAGDVNGSYYPPLKMIDNEVELQNEGVIFVNNSEEFNLPVTVKNNTELGAMGLVINFPSELIKIKEADSKIKGMVYNIINNEVRIAFTDEGEEGIKLNANDTIVNLKIIAHNLNSNNEISLSLNAESILADVSSNIIRGEVINIPRIAIQQSLGSGYYLSQNYPNPFSSSTAIDYFLPEDASVRMKLYDMLGNEICVLTAGNQTSGYHNIIFNASGLSSGLYLYSFNAHSANSQYTKTRVLIISQ